MKRSETPFPQSSLGELCAQLEEFWNEGVFDEYTEEHFIIRALHEDDEYFKMLFLRRRFKANADGFSLNFAVNFSMKTQFFIKNFGKENVRGFFADQLSAGKGNYNEDVFFEALSEFYLLLFFLGFGPAEVTNAEYEPRLGTGDKNPEARIEYADGTILDIEIKTPEFPERNLLANVVIPTYLLTGKGRRELTDYCAQHSISCLMPRVLKLKDYLNYAGEKFTPPQNGKHINLLVINWSASDLYESGLFEPVTLLCNPRNGVFVNRDAAKSIGVSDEALSRVTAALVYKLPVETLLFNDFRYLFATRGYRIIMNPFAEKYDINAVHELTKMAVHMPEELADERFGFYNLEERDWSEELIKISEIIDKNSL